jgi:hypothetical protein
MAIEFVMRREDEIAVEDDDIFFLLQLFLLWLLQSTNKLVWFWFTMLFLFSHRHHQVTLVLCFFDWNTSTAKELKHNKIELKKLQKHVKWVSLCFFFFSY